MRNVKKAMSSVKKDVKELKSNLKKAKKPSPNNEKKVQEARQRSRGTAGTKSTATPVTRNTSTNARGGNKPLKGGTAAQATSTSNHLKRVQRARTKDAAAKAAKAAAKAGVAKGAVRLAAKAIPVVGTASLINDAYDAVKENPRPASEKKAESTRRAKTKASVAKARKNSSRK